MDHLIAEADWESYFNHITKLMRGHLLGMEVVGLDVGDQIEQDWVACDGFSYDAKLETLQICTSPLSHLIPHPKEIYALEEGLIVRSICVKNHDDNYQLLHFREPLMLAEKINKIGEEMATNANKDSSQDKNARTPVQQSENRRPAMISSFSPMPIFDEVFRRLLSGFEGNDQFLAIPRVDIEERKNEYFVTVDIPGVPKEDIVVEIDGNQLTITAERAIENEGKRRSTRAYGSFQRTLTLPPGVDTANISASVKDGVLSIHIPRSEQSTSRRIQMGDGSQSASGKDASAH